MKKYVEEAEGFHKDYYNDDEVGRMSRGKVNSIQIDMSSMLIVKTLICKIRYQCTEVFLTDYTGQALKGL